MGIYLDLIPGIGNSERAVVLDDLIETFSNGIGLLGRHSGVYFSQIGCAFPGEMANQLGFYASHAFPQPHRHVGLILIASPLLCFSTLLWCGGVWGVFVRGLRAVCLFGPEIQL